MREVNNNSEVGKIPQRRDAGFGKAEEAFQDVAPNVEENIASTFDDAKAEVLGRSHVNNLNALQNDINFGMKNPAAIQQADKFFDMAYAQTGDYAKASELTAAYVDEFHK